MPACVCLSLWVQGLTETGKGLSSNDYTAEEKAQVAKIAGIEAAQENVIETVKVNGTALTPDAQKAVDVPTVTHWHTADGAKNWNGIGLNFPNSDGGVTFTGSTDALNMRATNQHNEAYVVSVPTETRVNALIAAAVTAGVGEITGFEYQNVATLPATGEKGVIYLVPNSGSNPNVKDEYIWINKGTAESPDYAFELLGTTELDLSGYLQSTDIEAITTAEIDAITGNTTP